MFVKSLRAEYKKPGTALNYTPFVRQYGIPNNTWGVFMPKGIPNPRNNTSDLFSPPAHDCHQAQLVADNQDTQQSTIVSLS